MNDLRSALEDTQRLLQLRDAELAEARVALRRAQNADRENMRIYNDSLAGVGYPTFDQWIDRESWNGATLELRRVVDEILAEPPATRAEILARMRVALSEGAATWLKRARAGKRKPDEPNNSG